MEELLKEYLEKAHVLETKGGIEGIAFNEKLEKLYLELVTIEDYILAHFGLPKMFEFRQILFDIKIEKNIRNTIERLQVEATKYLVSTPKSDLDLLQEAKRYDLRTYEVLPEIGIEDCLYMRFVFENYFKKEKLTVEEFLNKFIEIGKNSVLLEKIGYLYSYNEVNNIQEKEKIIQELLKYEIPFLDEYLCYKPTYPY